MRKFILYHDALVDRKLAIPDDENHRGVLSKARGQFARLAMFIHILNQAVDEAQEIYTTEQVAVAASPSDWCTEVGEDAVAFAEVVMNHFISHKFCLMPTELVVTDDQNLSCLKRFLLDKIKLHVHTRTILSYVLILIYRDKTVRLFMYGDYQFLCIMYGLSGPSG